MNIQRKNSAHHFRMQSEREQTLGVGQLTIHMCWRAWHFPRRATPWLLQSGQEFLHHPVFPLLANHHRRWGRAACRATLAHALRYAQLSSPK